MANPNVFAPVSNQYLTSIAVNCGTAATTVVPAVTTSHVIQIPQFLASNKTAANTVDFTFTFIDSSATTTATLLNSIAPKSSLSLSGVIAPLNEGDKIVCYAGLASAIDILIGYQEIY